MNYDLFMLFWYKLLSIIADQRKDKKAVTEK